MASRRFPILFTGINRGMVAVGLVPRWCAVEVDGDRVTVRMSLAFRTTISRASVQRVARTEERVWAWGVHGWRGRWLVNGSSRNLVHLDLEPHQRAFVLGVPVRLRQLRMSVTEPDALVAALS